MSLFSQITKSFIIGFGTTSGALSAITIYSYSTSNKQDTKYTHDKQFNLRRNKITPVKKDEEIFYYLLPYGI